MDFIRNLFTLFQRLQDIIRDGQKRGDMPGMAMALLREVRGGDRDADGQGDGPAVYQGRRAQADQATPSAASRATARNKAARDTDLPEPAVYRSPAGADFMAELEPARAPARNADDPSEKLPEPASAGPLQREEYDYQPASANASDIPEVPEPVQAEESEPQPASNDEPDSVPEPETVATVSAVNWDDDEDIADEPADGESDDDREPALAAQATEPVSAPPENAEPANKADKDEDWFDLNDWQGTALKVAGVGAAAAATAAGAMAIKDRFFDDEDEEKEPETDPEARAIPLRTGEEPMVQHDRAAERTDTETVAGAAAAATALPTSGVDADAPAKSAPAAQPQPAQQVEIIPADPRNPATQPASQTLANPGIRLYGTLNAEMYAEFTERLSEQEPGGPIVIALTTMEGDPEIARSMADDIRLLRDRGRREIIFLGKTAVYGAGVLFMAAFPVSHRYLTRATKVLITENKRAQPIQLAGGSLRSVASQLEHVQREIRREIEQEDQDYRAISEGSNVSVQELREKAPNEWFITASEAKAMGLIAEVV